jgi:hypothetical protein
VVVAAGRTADRHLERWIGHLGLFPHVLVSFDADKALGGGGGGGGLVAQGPGATGQTLASLSGRSQCHAAGWHRSTDLGT